MSTILDALKKVEQERETEAASGQQRQLDALTPETHKPHSGPSRKLIIRGAMAMAVLLFGGSALYLFLGDRDPSPSHASRSIADSPKAATPGKKAKRTIVAKSKKRMGDTSVGRAAPQATQRRKSLAERRANSPQAPQSSPLQTPNTNRPAVKKDSKATVSETAKRLPHNLPPVTAAPVPERIPLPEPRPRMQNPPATRPKAKAPSPKAAPKPPAPPKPKPAPAPRQAQAESNIPRLTDGSIKVQAIAWSPDRDESMAVMNSKIVREGGSVDDYAVVSIRQDDVVVRRGGQEFRVVIGRN